MQEDQNQELMDQEGTEAFAAGFDDEPGKPAEQPEHCLLYTSPSPRDRG